MKILTAILSFCLFLSSLTLSAQYDYKLEKSRQKENKKRSKQEAKARKRSPVDYKKGQQRKDKGEASQIKKKVKKEEKKGNRPKVFIPSINIHYSINEPSNLNKPFYIESN